MTYTLEQIKELCEKAGYEVHPNGNVYSAGTNWRGYGRRMIKAYPNSKGYLRVRFTFNGERKSVFVHKLVMKFFGPTKPGSNYEICHNNGIKSDNRICNLRWGTKKDNAADRTMHGHCKAAENGRKSASKLMKIKCSRGHSYAIYLNGRKNCRECNAQRMRVKRGQQL